MGTGQDMPRCEVIILSDNFFYCIKNKINKINFNCRVCRSKLSICFFCWDYKKDQSRIIKQQFERTIEDQTLSNYLIQCLYTKHIDAHHLLDNLCVYLPFDISID